MGNSLMNWLKSLFWKQEMELTLLGLQNSGKSTLVHAITTGGAAEDMTPTVGFNMKKVTKGNVTIKLWDVGGQPKYRSMWERYCRGVNAIVYVLDAADEAKFSEAKEELHQLVSKPQLANIPILVLGNKCDLSNAITDEEVLRTKFELDKIQGREVCVYSISAKEDVKIDVTIDWLIRHADQPEE